MSIDFAAQRHEMLEGQVRVSDVTDYAVQDAVGSVARETLLPPDKAALAYADTEIEYAPGRWLLRCRDVAKLVQALKARPGERALAIAAPYAGALLAAMGLTVTHLDEGDLTQPSGAYDVVVSEGVVSDVPAGWSAVLAEGGRLAAIRRDGPIGRAELYLNTAGHVGRRDLFDCAAPIMAGFEPKPAFTF